MPETALQSWTPADRSFKPSSASAQWHDGGALASRICTLIIVLVAVTLMSPIFYMVMGSRSIASTFITPMPNLMQRVLESIGALIDAPDPGSVGRWLYLGFLAALPGLLVMSVVVLALGRIIREVAQDSAALAAAHSYRLIRRASVSRRSWPRWPSPICLPLAC